MESKTCTQCGQVKPLDAFHRRDGKFGCAAACIDCANTKKREHWAANRERLKQKGAAYRSAHREEAKQAAKVWRLANPERHKASVQSYPKRRPEVIKAINARKVQKRRSSPKKRLQMAVSAAVRAALKAGAKAGQATFDLLGYSADDLRSHLEVRFLPGMTWENYGKWHVDHVIPLAAFNYERPEHLDFRRAWALSNLQPLWAADNIRKRDTLSAPFQPSLAL